MWKSWITAILGLWVLIVPFTGISGTTLMWTLVVTGAVVAVLGLWSGIELSTDQQEGRSLRQAHS